MKIRAQIGMVLNLDKCIGCHTCSVTCKNVWTNREGVEYAWFNNVETKPGIGYPKDWENQKRWNGGWKRTASGKIQPRMGGKWRILSKIFANPDLPEIDDYYEALHLRLRAFADRAGVVQIAASMAMRDALREGRPVLLEPLMSVEVVAPVDFIGVVQGDLNARRGSITGLETRAGAQVVGALVPLAQMFGYVNALRSMTQGRATYTMQFSLYAQVPEERAREIVRTYY